MSVFDLSDRAAIVRGGNGGVGLGTFRSTPAIRATFAEIVRRQRVQFPR